MRRVTHFVEGATTARTQQREEDEVAEAQVKRLEQMRKEAEEAARLKKLLEEPQ